MNQVMNMNNNETISTIDLRAMVNEARKLAGENPVRNDDFVSRAEDELGSEIQGAEFLHLAPRTKTEMVAYKLTYRQAMLVTMRERNRQVRETVLARLSELQVPVTHVPRALPQTGNVTTMSSLEIAELTGKEHYNVIIDVRNMLSELGFQPLDFSSGYKDAKGETRPCYQLPKRETLILVSGYNLKMRAAIIDRWQELEGQVQKPQLPQTYHEALRALADEAEKNLMLTQKIEEDAPKVTFTDSITASETSITVERFAKLYKTKTLGRNNMFALLRNFEILRSNNLPYQSFMKYFELREFVTPSGLARTQTLINTRGQVYLSNRLDKYFKEVALSEQQI